MLINGTKVEVTKRTMDEIIARDTDRVWTPRQTTIGPIPNDQKYAVVALALSPAIIEDDQDAIMTSIEAIVGVQRAIVASYGTAPSAAETPTGKETILKIRTATDFRDIA